MNGQQEVAGPKELPSSTLTIRILLLSWLIDQHGCVAVPDPGGIPLAFSRPEGRCISRRNIGVFMGFLSYDFASASACLLASRSWLPSESSIRIYVRILRRLHLNYLYVRHSYSVVPNPKSQPTNPRAFPHRHRPNLVMGEDKTGIRTCPGEDWCLKNVTSRSGPVVKAEKPVLSVSSSTGSLNGSGQRDSHHSFVHGSKVWIELVSNGFVTAKSNHAARDVGSEEPCERLYHP